MRYLNTSDGNATHVIKYANYTSRRVRASTYGEYLWSSCEDSQYNARFFGTYNGRVYYDDKEGDLKYRRVRAFLTSSL